MAAVAVRSKEYQQHYQPQRSKQSYPCAHAFHQEGVTYKSDPDLLSSSHLRPGLSSGLFFQIYS
jgi:hypothetical protein